MGNHIIYYTLSDTNGCESVDSVLLVVEDCLGFTNYVSSEIEIYPNPTEGNTVITFGSKSSQDFNIMLFNNLGEEVFVEKENIPAGVCIYTEPIASGLYIVLFTERDSGVQIRIRLVVEK